MYVVVCRLDRYPCRVKNQSAVCLPTLYTAKVHKHLLFKMCLEGTEQFPGFVNFNKVLTVEATLCLLSSITNQGIQQTYPA